MPPPNTDNTKIWAMAKGSLKVNGLNVAWDFTDGLTKEQFMRRYEREVEGKHEMIVLKSGRIIIPTMNIY